MPVALESLAELTDEQLKALPEAEFLSLLESAASKYTATRQQQQLLFYEPANPRVGFDFHKCLATEIVCTGGNRSSKTEGALVEMVIQMTGVVPFCLEDVYPKEKLRTPIRARLICQSLTNTWEQVILPKLQWWKWTGSSEPGGSNGHWGWIPKNMLIGGDWSKSWSEKYRMLTLANGTTMQVMSHGQEVADFASSSLHFILNDEGPKHGVYRENKMRILDVGGRIYTAFTPPDDESASWDAAWIYDELYEKGLPGPGKDPEIESFTLYTEDNRYLRPEDIVKIVKGLTATQKEVRLKGAFLHLTGRVFPLYTDKIQHWCFSCNDVVISSGGKCLNCKDTDVVDFCHLVEPFEVPTTWPVIMVIDPHPRKPHTLSWVAVDPTDDLWQVAELEVNDEPVEVKKAVDRLESDHHLQVCKRIMDPNMGESPDSSSKRTTDKVRESFDKVGLRCDMADDDQITGRSRVKEYLKPDARTRRPRLHVFQTCARTNSQMNKWCWAEWARYSADTRDPKPATMNKNDDFPKNLIYAVNCQPTFAGLRMGMRPIKRPGRRKGPYG